MWMMATGLLPPRQVPYYIFFLPLKALHIVQFNKKIYIDGQLVVTLHYQNL